MVEVTAITSNDIIAGNGKILSVHDYFVVKYLSKKLYYAHELFFLFPSDYTVGIRISDIQITINYIWLKKIHLKFFKH